MAEETPNEDAERLVAYLDGELDDANAIQVEQLLASKPETRHDIERLARTWDLLDLLPNARASQEFTQRTLTAIRSKAPSEVGLDDEEAESTRIHVTVAPRTNREIWRNIGIRTVAFLGLAVVATAGFHSTYDPGTKFSEEMLRLYPVIHRLDEYRSIRDPKFLKELHDSEMFSNKGRKNGPPNR